MVAPLKFKIHDKVKTIEGIIKRGVITAKVKDTESVNKQTYYITEFGGCDWGFYKANELVKI